MQQFGLHAKRSRRCLVFQIYINWHEGSWRYCIFCNLFESYIEPFHKSLVTSEKSWYVSFRSFFFLGGGVAGKLWFCTYFFYFCSIQWLNMVGWILYTYISTFVHTLYDVTSPCCRRLRTAGCWTTGIKRGSPPNPPTSREFWKSLRKLQHVFKRYPTATLNQRNKEFLHRFWVGLGVCLRGMLAR